MPVVVYIHGFLSSSQSTKAMQVKHWLQAHRPDWAYVCPDLSSYPSKTQCELESLMARLLTDYEQVFFVGSSLGGFWATYLVERFGGRAVLVNPSVEPALRCQEIVGEPIKNYYSDEIYTLTGKDIQILEECNSLLLHNSERYWLMVQTDDEVLDYKNAVSKYKNCRQTIEQGGNHSFEGFEKWLPQIVDFFEYQ